MENPVLDHQVAVTVVLASIVGALVHSRALDGALMKQQLRNLMDTAEDPQNPVNRAVSLIAGGIVQGLEEVEREIAREAAMQRMSLQ